MTPSYNLLLSAPTHFLICYGLLAAAILSVWVRPRFWRLLFVASAGYGFAVGILSLIALETTAFFLIATHIAFKSKTPFFRMVGYLATLLSSGAILLNLIPGFEPWIIGQNLQLSQRAIPFTHVVAYQYGVLVVCILGSGAVPILKRKIDWVLMLRQHLWIAVIACVSLGAITWSTNYVGWDFTWTPYFYLWAFTNFFFICAGEEAVFRGLIHSHLQKHLGRWKGHHINPGEWLALFIATGLYVLRHAYEGELIMLFTGVAGLFISYAYMRYRSVEGAMFVHFAINSIQFLAFTYPVVL
ncbi:MAG: CPBP family intramembrane glutamic endopeptidase [Pseudomonadota bacterium]